MDDERFLEFMRSWDDVSSAIDIILTAQPFQMTEASKNLFEQRYNMRETIKVWGRPADPKKGGDNK